MTLCSKCLKGAKQNPVKITTVVFTHKCQSCGEKIRRTE